jgi:hypothetical protein
MGKALKRTGKELPLFCPHCSSQKIVRNGYHHKGKLQFYCTTCHKYFYEDPARGYPPTSIPFPVIAYLLYSRQKVPEFSNMRKFRKFVTHWLQHLNISDQEVSRQKLYHWIKNYEQYLDRVITFSEARGYCKQRLAKIGKPLPEHKPIPYGRALKILEHKFGKAYCVKLIRTDETFFKELVDIISKHGVFSWELNNLKLLSGGYER